MNILVTGAKGFVGKNLVCALKNIRDGKDRTRPSLCIDEIYEYDTEMPVERLNEFCETTDFVYNFAGVNRPETADEFMRGNRDFTELLLSKLKACGNTCPVAFASSVQAALTGRYAGSEYGISKRAMENLAFGYSEKTGAEVFVYRFPNIFGKWCRPNYNSAVATFCHNTANDLPITVNDENTELELLYIDDLVSAMLDAAEKKVFRCDYDGVHPIPNEEGQYCYVPVVHRVTLGEITALLKEFKKQADTLLVPMIPDGSFAKKLYSTYLSYLPYEKVTASLKMNIDDRGSFTELLKTAEHGQISVNISNPGVTKGMHWHNSKWEIFTVVSGHGVIRQRKIGTDEVLEFEVSGDKIESVYMLPGYTHEITNLSETDKLITVMWANEVFDPNKPDTYFEKVK